MRPLFFECNLHYLRRLPVFVHSYSLFRRIVVNTQAPWTQGISSPNTKERSSDKDELPVKQVCNLRTCSYGAHGQYAIAPQCNRSHHHIHQTSGSNHQAKEQPELQATPNNDVTTHPEIPQENVPGFHMQEPITLPLEHPYHTQMANLSPRNQSS